MSDKDIRFALIATPSGVLSDDCSVTLHTDTESAMAAMRAQLKRMEATHNPDRMHEPGFTDEVSLHGHCPTTDAEWQVVEL